MTDKKPSNSPELEELDLTGLHFIDREEEAAADTADQVTEENPLSPPVLSRAEAVPFAWN